MNLERIGQALLFGTMLIAMLVAGRAGWNLTFGKYRDQTSLPFKLLLAVASGLIVPRAVQAMIGLLFQE